MPKIRSNYLNVSAQCSTPFDKRTRDHNNAALYAVANDWGLVAIEKAKSTGRGKPKYVECAACKHRCQNDKTSITKHIRSHAPYELRRDPNEWPVCPFCKWGFGSRVNRICHIRSCEARPVDESVEPAICKLILHQEEGRTYACRFTHTHSRTVTAHRQVAHGQPKLHERKDGVHVYRQLVPPNETHSRQVVWLPTDMDVTGFDTSAVDPSLLTNTALAALQKEVEFAKQRRAAILEAKRNQIKGKKQTKEPQKAALRRAALAVPSSTSTPTTASPAMLFDSPLPAGTPLTTPPASPAAFSPSLSKPSLQGPAVFSLGDVPQDRHRLPDFDESFAHVPVAPLAFVAARPPPSPPPLMMSGYVETLSTAQDWQPSYPPIHHGASPGTRHAREGSPAFVPYHVPEPRVCREDRQVAADADPSDCRYAAMPLGMPYSPSQAYDASSSPLSSRSMHHATDHGSVMDAYSYNYPAPDSFEIDNETDSETDETAYSPAYERPEFVEGSSHGGGSVQALDNGTGHFRLRAARW